MPRPEQNPFEVVDPDAPRTDAGLGRAVRILIGGGFPEVDARWLAPLLLEVLPNAHGGKTTLSEEADVHLGIVSLTWTLAEGDRDSVFLLLLATLSNAVHIPRLITQPADGSGHGEVWAMPEAVGDRIVAEFQRHDIDFTRVLCNGWPTHLRNEWARDRGAGVLDRYQSFFRLLIRTGAVDLTKIIDVQRMRDSGASYNWTPSGFTLSGVGAEWSDGVSWLDPRSLRVWAWFVGVDALARFTPAFLREPGGTIPALAFAVAQAAATWVGRPGHERHYEAFELAGTHFARVMRVYFEHLDARHESTPDDPRLHEAWMLFFRLAWDAESSACPDSLRKRLVEQATEDLAKFRKVFTAATSEGESEAARDFQTQRSHFTQSAIVLARYGGVWKCMKSLLLALRALNTRAVAHDLRYWNEVVGDEPPQPWCAIPSTMIALFHFYVGVEQEQDPDLKKLRTEFALFLLDRLTDQWTPAQRVEAEAVGASRTDAEMKEPVPAWRYCLVRAVMDLQIDPEGRGHKALRWSAHHDPDPRVREVAKSGHEKLRHTKKLPANMSPRRAVLSALWWYRQGHLLGLGIQPDPDGAQRTRTKELSRTKEASRDNNPAVS